MPGAATAAIDTPLLRPDSPWPAPEENGLTAAAGCSLEIVGHCGNPQLLR
jgi:hypothetical protein